MYVVDVADLQSRLSVKASFIERVVVAALQTEGVASAEIAVALVDDARIREVNREHLGHDYATDVISFAYDSSGGNPEADQGRGRGMQLDGELVVSTETAAREAAPHGWTPEDELTLYLVHGLLHLCGYDDLTDGERIIMRRRERDILQIWNLLPHYSE